MSQLQKKIKSLLKKKRDCMSCAERREAIKAFILGKK